MKRDMEQLNLRDAFKQEPDFCHAALMQAAYSVKEEKEVKRASFRALIIAAIIIVSMTAVAFAAGQLMGWTDFHNIFSNADVPQAAKEEMQVANSVSWEVGPMTFTATELLNDGHIALSSIRIATTDGSKTLITSNPWNTVGMYGENAKGHAAQLGVDPETSCIEAAKQLNLPLYNVRGILDVDPETVDSLMEYPLWNEDGSMTYLSMTFLKQIPAKEAIDHLPYRHIPANGEKYVAPFFLRVAKVDPVSGEETESWVDRTQNATIAISGVVEEKAYYPEDKINFDGFEFQHAHMQRHATGAYTYLVFNADQSLTEEDAYNLHNLFVEDAQGNLLPEGMDMSASLDTTAWPQVILIDLYGLETLPESLILESNGITVTAR